MALGVREGGEEGGEEGGGRVEKRKEREKGEREEGEGEKGGRVGEVMSTCTNTLPFPPISIPHTLTPTHTITLTTTLTHSPEHSWVILLLKDAGLASDDDTVALHLLLHVGGIAGSIVGEQEGAVCHPMHLYLQQRTIHDQCVDCWLDPGYLQGGRGEGWKERGGREGERVGGRGWVVVVGGAEDAAMKDRHFKNFSVP